MQSRLKVVVGWVQQLKWSLILAFLRLLEAICDDHWMEITSVGSWWFQFTNWEETLGFRRSLRQWFLETGSRYFDVSPPFLHSRLFFRETTATTVINCQCFSTTRAAEWYWRVPITQNPSNVAHLGDIHKSCRFLHTKFCVGCNYHSSLQNSLGCFFYMSHQSYWLLFWGEFLFWRFSGVI